MASVRKQWPSWQFLDSIPAGVNLHRADITAIIVTAPTSGRFEVSKHSVGIRPECERPKVMTRRGLASSWGDCPSDVTVTPLDTFILKFVDGMCQRDLAVRSDSSHGSDGIIRNAGEKVEPTDLPPTAPLASQPVAACFATNIR